MLAGCWLPVQMPLLLCLTVCVLMLDTYGMVKQPWVMLVPRLVLLALALT